MLKQVTPEKVIDVTWLSVAVAFCWPLPLNASKAQVLTLKILQICTLVNALMLLLPLLYSAYLHRDDTIIVSKCVCLSFGAIQIIVQTLVCFVKHDYLQRITYEMVIYVKQADKFERDIYHKYIEKCKMFYGGCLVWVYVCAFGFTVGPTILPNPLPTDGEYPFRVNYTPIYITVYLQQSFTSLQCAAHVCMGMFGALLLWFTAARFECLSAEVQQCSNLSALIACVKKQMRLKSYAEDVVAVFKLMVVIDISISTFALTLCCVTLVTNAPLFAKVQFITVCFTILLEVYMYAWPADYMKDMSINVAQNSYNLVWYEKTLDVQNTVLYMLMHQEPVIFSASCILPELSLRYFCSYLSNAYSFFTALRVMLEEDSTES